MKKLTRWTLWTLLASVAVPAVVVAATYTLKIVLYGTPINEAEVRPQVAAANYCTITTDCAVAPGDCPFFYELVNVKEKQMVADLYTRYHAWKGLCMYSAMDMRDFDRVSCTLGKCVAALKGK